MNRVKQHLKDEALTLGFHDVRFVEVCDDLEAGRYLDAFLADGRHGDMDWMARHADRRRSPKALWPEAKSAVLLALSYTPEYDPLEGLQHPSSGAVSVYAKGKDYHDIVKPKLKQLARSLQGRTGCDVKVFVDTAPLMEKPLAERAGLGWQGKHTNLVSRTGGSWFFIGAILTTAPLLPDAAEVDHCGGCTRCLDVCPTGAFPGPYQLDARRCISYLTIEHKGHVDRALRKPMGNRIYGCDDCLAVCPWNKFAVMAGEQRLKAREETDNPPLKDLLSMDDTQFRQRFKGTPVKRTGRDRMLRNVLIAAGNSGDKALMQFVSPHLDDPSPLVRAMAVWALRELMPRDEFSARYSACAANEQDADVAAEWRYALGASSPTFNHNAAQSPSDLTKAAHE